jgi:cell wall-associated NlpC family hydrolase
MAITTSSDNFVYTPDISVIINSVHGVQEVSSDLIDFSLQRQVNAVSTFSCTLANPNFKYNFDSSNSIRTMDRITVFLKRTSYVQVFTGYITYAPLVTLFPEPITITAQCTLRILQVTYWDNTLVTFQTLLLNAMDTAASASSGLVQDGGAAQATVNLLTQVCGWNSTAIHIQSIPQAFINLTQSAYANMINSNNLDANVYADVAKAIGAQGIASGKNVITGNTTGNSDAPNNGVDFTVTQAKAFMTQQLPGANGPNKPGSNANNPVNIGSINSTTEDTEGIYYCSLPFSYLKTPKMSAKDKSNAKSWIAHNRTKNKDDGRLVEVTTLDRTVVLRATSVPQKAMPAQLKGQAVYDPSVDYAQIHPSVVAYLNGKIGDPKNWSDTNDPGFVSKPIQITWADQTKVKVGIQPAFAKSTTNQDTSSTGGIDYGYISGTIYNVIQDARSQIGVPYAWGGRSQGKGFDCSGLMYWAYSKQNIKIGYDTYTQCGPLDGSKADKYGQWIGNTKQPQPGDLLFFGFPATSNDSQTPPNHVVMMTVAFGDPDPGYISSGTKGDTKRSSAVGKPGVGYTIQAPQTGKTVMESAIYWKDIAGGKGYYLGARRPISLSKQSGIDPKSNPSEIVTTTQSLNPGNATTRAINALSDAYSNLFQVPAFDPRATVLVGTPRAFLLDNPVMSDLTQIMSAGMRMYQSAPNGDFVAWFPDYYGVYGTDPVLEISPVEIINFNVYHNDDQLTTHVGVVGDTTGIGQQVSEADFFTTNGLVSVQDITTMRLLFNDLPIAGSNAVDGGPIQTESTTQYLNNLDIVDKFLNKYGLRPQVIQQSMIHSQMMEYFLALQTFMLDWVNQFVSTVQTTFLPELYPGMRIVVNIPNQKGTTDKYEFYVMSVTHQGSRSGGFTTQFDVTAPKKNNNIMHYGLNIK